MTVKNRGGARRHNNKTCMVPSCHAVTGGFLCKRHQKEGATAAKKAPTVAMRELVKQLEIAQCWEQETTRGRNR